VNRPERARANVTVAISTRDRPAMLARCLDSLAASTRMPSEIVVVDQSRDDTSREVVAARVDAPRIRHVPHAGSGLGVSQNVAFREAACPVVAVIDDDCVAAEDWIEVIANAFDGDPDLALLAGRVLPLGPAEEGRHPVSTRTSTVARDFGRRDAPWDVGSGNNFAARAEWLRRIGGNDERLGPGSPGLGGVDMDLFRRLLAAGARARYEPASIVFHEQADRADRRARRYPYGYGMGACCVLWMRQRDRAAPSMLGRWLSMRLGRLVEGARRRDWERAREEVDVVRGTFAGLYYGLRVHR
jgi:GT2 family glycosyltransferase